MDVSGFGVLGTSDGGGRRDVDRVAMQSSALRVGVVTYGAALHTVEAPDRHGRHDHVCLSLAELADHEDPVRNPYLGATCGRYASRIADARFELDGRAYPLAANDGPHHLHGGPQGFSRRVWDLIEASATDDGGRVVLSLQSPDGDGGYPGTLHATATYELHGHQLRITYEAMTDAPTVVNLCNHAYWNLGGSGRWSVPGAIGDHEVRIAADHVLPAGADAVPTGPLAPVDASLDLRRPRPVDDLLVRSGGVDHSYATARSSTVDEREDGLHLAAEVHHEATGRTLTVATDQPAVHLYTGNHLGPPFARQAALCLEAQRFPDAPNRPDLPSPVLRPGDRYRSTTELTFGVR